MNTLSELETHLLECMVIASGYEEWQKGHLQKPELNNGLKPGTEAETVLRPNRIYPIFAPLLFLTLIWIILWAAQQLSCSTDG